MYQDDHPANKEFEKLTLCHVESLYRLAYARVGSRHDAEDIVQETYLKAFRSFNRFSHRTNIKNWLSQILINTIRDHFRKSLRSISTVDIDDALEDWSGATTPGPEEEICNFEVDAALQQALRAMPEQLVIPLLLREIHDATYDEIARVLDIPPGTVMSRLYRARSLLRRNLLSRDTTESKMADDLTNERGVSDELQ